ncbi:MAG: efflux RND transporter periplasmic adaptor subunit [Cyclobacteriaceae bacterium]|nr:efflux RND transporter periplasmic adaptor subunit [Cyclobacteriaceae bacterium]
MKSILTLLLPGMLLVACATDDKATSTIKNEVPVSFLSVQAELLQPEIETAGVFTTDDETLLAFKTGGVIEKIYVKEGDRIKSGQLLATLNLTEIEAQVAQAQLAFEKTTRDFNRTQNLYKDSVATLEQYQNTRTALEVATRQVESARFNKVYSEIRALSNGMVMRKLANEGQIISPGTTVFQTNGSGTRKWILKAAISDREWATLQIGDAATVTSDVLPGKTWTGTVTKKSATVDVSLGALNIEITLNEHAELASGIFGKATIRATQKQKAWKIPYQALLDGNAQQGYVFINQYNKAHKVPVTVSEIKKDYVLITAGLQDGDQLIVSGSAYLKEGTPLTIAVN